MVGERPIASSFPEFVGGRAIVATNLHALAIIINVFLCEMHLEDVGIGFLGSEDGLVVGIGLVYSDEGFPISGLGVWLPWVWGVLKM